MVAKNSKVENQDQVTIQMKGITNRPISDMDNNGVYFIRENREDIQVSIEEEKEVSICYYSGLPSLESYIKGIQEVKER